MHETKPAVAPKKPSLLPVSSAPGALRSAQAASRFSSIRWDSLWEQYGIATILLIIWGVAALTIPVFSNPDNFLEVLRQSSFVGIAAVGMTFAILMGTFDLSVVSTLGLCAWLAVTLAAHHNLPLALTLPILVGALIGAINGTLVAFMRIPAFIVTLSMQFLIAGFTYIIADNQEALYFGKEFISLGTGYVADALPTPFVIFIVCALVAAIVLRFTAFGRYVFATGSNTRSAELAGVPVRWTLFAGFVVVGMFTAISAVLLGARLYSAGPGLEPGFELNVIAAVVLGGTRLSGGRGTILGTFAAALLFTTLSNILNLLSIDTFVQQVVTGCVLLVALSIEGVRGRLAERFSRRV